MTGGLCRENLVITEVEEEGGSVHACVDAR